MSEHINETPLLEVKHLRKLFPVKQTFRSGEKTFIKAVDDVSFTLNPKETLGVVGESGCGKSTMGRSVLRLIEPTDGEIIYKGQDFKKASGQELRKMRAEMQIIFQDPYASLDPKMKVQDIIAEGIRAHGLAKSEKEIKERVNELLVTVGLNAQYGERYIHEFSGGQRQRIGIARALAVEPEFIVCDEPISALDVSIQAQIVNLLDKLQEEKGLTYDEKGFEEAQKEQRAKSEGTFGTHNYSGKDASVYDELDAELSSEFVGYDQLEVESDVTAMTSETEVVDALTDGDKGTIIVAKTPFYATMGGQEADKGIICTEDGEFVVEDVVKLAGGKFGHVGQVTKGMIKVGDKVTLKVDKENRALAENNHSATHLLQKALRMVLGNHVEQAGSLNNAQRLRFDFTHFSAMTAEELQKVEDIVNEKIRENLPVVIKNMPIEEAKKTGAQALFGEKYGDIVRVVSMGDFSIEFCGGTHVKNTGNIMAFKILSETGVAAGVRRIEALTSKGLLDYYSAQEKKLHETAKLLKATPENIEEKVSHLMNENKALKGEVESLKSKLAKDAMGDVMNQVEEVKGVKFLATSLEGVDMNGLRDLGDQLKEKLGEGVILLASVNDGKVSLMATATDGAMKQGAHAGNLIKAVAKLVGGGGGGRPNMAQAGGKNPAGVEDALKAAKEALEGQLA